MKKIKNMKKITLILILACCIFGACIMIMGGCKKETPAQTFTCTIDGATFTPTSISASTSYGTNGCYTITATYSSVSVTQQIKLWLSSSTIGTYQLNYNYPENGHNGGAYDTGPNVNALVEYSTFQYSNPPATGTCIISSSANNVISGTFNFTGYNLNGTPTTHTIANGSFANITL